MLLDSMLSPLFFERYPLVLTDGAVLERLRRDPNIDLDPHVLHAALLFDPRGREILQKISEQYLQIAVEAELPILLITSTFRSDPERVTRAGLNFERLHRAAVELLDQLRQRSGEFREKVIIGGVLGPKNDAYDPKSALDFEAASEYHQTQAGALVKAGVDLLLPLTLCAASEARGMAHAVAKAGCPAILSLLPDAHGRLLDGTPLERLIEQIDSEAKPLGYMLNCCHSSVARATLTALRQRQPQIASRIIGLKANTSSRTPAELEGLKQVDTESPEFFADAVYGIGVEFGLKLIGGCCGTDHSHIYAVAQKLMHHE